MQRETSERIAKARAVPDAAVALTAAEKDEHAFLKTVLCTVFAREISKAIRPRLAPTKKA